MPKGSKRRSNQRYDVFEAGDKIALPDYKMFEDVCREAAQELGMNWKELLFIYKKYVDISLELMFPEGNPRSLEDEMLLLPRRMIRIPGIVTAELTPKSLRRWRKIEEAIRKHRNKQNDNYKTD